MIEMSPMLVRLQRCKTKLPGLLPITLLSDRDNRRATPTCCGALHCHHRSIHIVCMSSLQTGPQVVQNVMLQDPVDKKPAVLVQRYNISQQKQLELQLHLQQEALQRSANYPPRLHPPRSPMSNQHSSHLHSHAARMALQSRQKLTWRLHTTVVYYLLHPRQHFCQAILPSSRCQFWRQVLSGTAALAMPWQILHSQPSLH